MPIIPIHNDTHLHFPHPHIGMRKIKSILAIFVVGGFLYFLVLPRVSKKEQAAAQ